MKKLIYTILLFGCMLTIVSCSDSEYNMKNLFPKEYYKVLYFKDNGMLTFNLNTTQTNYQDSILVIKAGSNLKLPADVKVVLQTQKDVDDSYGKLYNKNYQILPAECYSFENGQELTFGENDCSQYLKLSIHADKIYKAQKANAGAIYVLPLKLISDKDTINSSKNQIFWVFDVKSPTITLPDADIEDQMLYKSIDLNLTAMMKNFDLNQWDFTCGLMKTGFEDLVSAYNTYHGTSYELLPSNSYTMNDISFTKGNNTGSSLLTINRSALQTDHTYILPLKLISTSMGEGFEISDKVQYLIFSNPKYGIIAPDRTNWKIAFCSSDNTRYDASTDIYGAPGILDGNLNSYWASAEDANWGRNYKNGDDYCYDYTEYRACEGDRPLGKIVMVVDMAEPRYVIGAGIFQRKNADRAIKSADYFVTSDPEFLFKTYKEGGSVSDYDNVALNNWTKLLTWSNIPQQSDTWSWTTTTTPVKGRFIKMTVTGAYHGHFASMAEFNIRQLVSIDGEPVK